MYVFIENGIVTRIVYDKALLTNEELTKAIKVDKLPQPEVINGKSPILKYDGRFYYEYVNSPLSAEERIKLLDVKIEILEQENAELWYTLLLKGVI